MSLAGMTTWEDSHRDINNIEIYFTWDSDQQSDIDISHGFTDIYIDYLSDW